METPIMTKTKFHERYDDELILPIAGEEGTSAPSDLPFTMAIAGVPGSTVECLAAHVYQQRNGRVLLAIEHTGSGDVLAVVKNFADPLSALAYAYDWAKANLAHDCITCYAERGK